MIGPRLKDLGCWFSGGTPPSERAEYWDGDVPWLSGKDFDKTVLREPTKFTTEEGAALYSRLVPGGQTVLVLVRGMALAHGLPVARLPFDAAINQDVRGLVLRPEFDPAFVYYALVGRRAELDAHIDRAAHGTARLLDTVYSRRIAWVPELAAQGVIATCLDRECARIELAAAAQAKLSSLGADAVTSDCAAIFSAGGAATIDGDDGVRLRFLVREVDERAETRRLPLLSVTIDRGVVRRDQLTDDQPRAIDRSKYKSVVARDIVVNRMRAFQGAVGVASEDGIVSPDYLVLRVRPNNDPSLIARALASPRGADVMASLIRGIGGVENGAVRTPRINTNDLLDVRLRVPPVAEQAQIVAALEQAERDSQTLGGIARAVGDALARYRDSLIHEAVTGKLDVTSLSDRQMDERLHAAAENRLDEVAV